MGNLKSIPLEEQVQILRQEVSRLTEETIKLQKYSKEQSKIIFDLIDATKKTYLELNDEITRVAKLRTKINTSLS